MSCTESFNEIEIIYADDYLVVVNKPTLLLSVPGRGEDKQDCLISRLAVKFPSILTVHRLDWETSGLTVLALNKDIHRQLSRQFQEREVNKEYIAVVYGHPEHDQGEINLPLRCDWENRPRQIVDPVQGKASQTFWQCLERLSDRSRILLKPVTGRSHQLRVHLQQLGHPILGAPLYAHPKALNMAERLLLHASQLEFKHPANGEMIKFCSPVPF